MRGICPQKSFPFKVHLALAKHVHQNVTSRMDRSVTHLFGKYQRGLSPNLMAYIQRLRITTSLGCDCGDWRKNCLKERHIFTNKNWIVVQVMQLSAEFDSTCEGCQSVD